jgi:hypothetical protein
MGRSDSACNRHVHTAAAQLDKEEDIEALQPDRLDRDEIDGQARFGSCWPAYEHLKSRSEYVHPSGRPAIPSTTNGVNSPR